MAAKKISWFEKLTKIDGAVDRDFDPYENTLNWSSPGLNSTFGNSWGIPRGYGAVLFGPPKAGKTLLLNDLTSCIHRSDPEGVVIKIDTEFREEGQLTRDHMRRLGIDPTRYICYQGNSPSFVFDKIEKDIAELCEEGMPLRALYIDSLNGIWGRRMENAESVDKQQIGDEAATLQAGLKRILAVQRKYRFAVIATSQVRAELDPLEVKRGNKYRQATAFATKHWAEFFLFVERFANKEGRVDALGNAFVGEREDAVGNAELTGHKIRVTMNDSSLSPKGRQAIFTVDYRKGIINTHEEVFELGKNRGVIDMSGHIYSFRDNKWNGKNDTLMALQSSPDICAQIVEECRKQDRNKEEIEAP